VPAELGRESEFRETNRIRQSSARRVAAFLFLSQCGCECLFKVLKVRGSGYEVSSLPACGGLSCNRFVVVYRGSRSRSAARCCFISARHRSAAFATPEHQYSWSGTLIPAHGRHQPKGFVRRDHTLAGAQHLPAGLRRVTQPGSRNRISDSAEPLRPAGQGIGCPCWAHRCHSRFQLRRCQTAAANFGLSRAIGLRAEGHLRRNGRSPEGIPDHRFRISPSGTREGAARRQALRLLRPDLPRPGAVHRSGLDRFREAREK
jgi:hypothetical protein